MFNLRSVLLDIGYYLTNCILKSDYRSNNNAMLMVIIHYEWLSSWEILLSTRTSQNLFEYHDSRL